MEIPASSIVRATWRGLLLPRRLLPILAVSLPLLYAQARWSRESLATPLAIAMCVAFVSLAPVSYRVLFPDGLELSHGAVRLVLYALIGAGVVLSIGVGVPRLLNMRGTFLTERSSLAIIIALFLVGGWGLGRDIGFEQRVARLQSEAERAQLLALRSTVDPHFLFNTLNAIAEWCRLDGAVAERAVLDLSAMLRAVLSGVKETSWPLSKELELARMVFELHLLRDRDLFQLDVSVPDPVPAAKVPPMCLLTMVENAMKHGPGPGPGPGAGHRGRVSLTVRTKASGLVVTLENPGRFTGRREGSAGLPSLERQLALAYGGHAKFTIEAVPGEDRTRAVLELPGDAA